MKKELITLVASVMAITCGPAIAQGATPSNAATSAPAVVPAPPAATDMVATLQKVCLPVLRGGGLKASASAAGYKQKDGQWVLTIDGDRRIELLPPDEANPHVCGATIYARPTSTTALQQALGRWASAQTPPLAPVKVDASVAGAAPPWIDSSWSAQTPAGALGVALGQEQAMPANPKPVLESDLQVSLTPA
ncbi:MAG TPA: hypothetical protein VKQ70_05545 [Caulobacteraceae bacterium]|jgi:hypothetical protein|nr:hypothetical protein [Caulobacteraceae bacterium]